MLTMRLLLLLLFMALIPLAIPQVASAAAGSAPDQGRFVVKSPKLTSSHWRDEARELQESGLLQEIANALNAIFILPRDIGLRFAECDEPNAYYDTEAHQILMCLELMEGMLATLDGQFESEDDEAEALAGAFIAVALHEAGHALVHVLEIPITGREEDAVDQLSAWVLIEADDVDSVLGAAATYYTEGEVEDADYAGEHSLDRQRYFNLVCWAYGSDPDNSQSLIDVWELPEARAANCADEYALLDRSWTRLLRGHLRESDDVDSTMSRTWSAGATDAGSERTTARPPIAPHAEGERRDGASARAVEKVTTRSTRDN